ncbi:MAG: hypothetical protein GWP36_00875 [Bacteroidetes bacterium]|nr:hypothetical protein [Bacteroidota bacterium]
MTQNLSFAASVLMIKRAVFFLVLMTIGMAQPVFAQQAVTNSDENAGAGVIDGSMAVRRIGLIDLEGVLRASKGTLRVRELLDEQRLTFQREFSARETKLQESERELVTLRETLSEEEFAKKLSEFEAEVAKIQQEIQYGREAIALAFQEAQGELRRMAVEIVTEVAREQMLDLVLVRDAALIFIPSLNLSEEVLRRLDERTKNARIEVNIRQNDVPIPEVSAPKEAVSE